MDGVESKSAMKNGKESERAAKSDKETQKHSPQPQQWGTWPRAQPAFETPCYGNNVKACKCQRQMTTVFNQKKKKNYEKL